MVPHILSSLWCNAAEEDFVDPDTGNTLNSTAVCLFWLNKADVVEAARVSTIQSTLNNRLSVAATVGDTALASAVTAIQNANPEVAAVILADTGADPLKYPYLVSHLTLPALSLLGIKCSCDQRPLAVFASRAVHLEGTCSCLLELHTCLPAGTLSDIRLTVSAGCWLSAACSSNMWALNYSLLNSAAFLYCSAP